MSLEILFWFLLFIPVHSYLIYPIIMRFMPSVKFPKSDANEDPSLSILISAYNEEKVIRERVANIAFSNYDFSKVEVLIGSDCSEDRTNSILADLQVEYSWLKIYLFKQRRGKAGVLNELVKYAKNSILVFTDANTVFETNSIKLLVDEFYNEKIGGVSGRLVLVEPQADFNKNVEEKKYWDYETLIKKNEGRCGVLIGANGGIFAVRKELYKEIPLQKAVTDDLYITLAVLNQDYKFMYKYEAAGYEEVPKEIGHEYKRKIRFSSTNFETLVNFKNLLFSRNVLLSYAFWSHKVIRWFFPFIFILIYILNVILLPAGLIYLLVFLMFNAFLLAAGAGGLLSEYKIHISFLSLPFFFLMTNTAIVLGFIRFLKKQHTMIWDSTPR